MTYDQLDETATRAYAKAIDACASVWNDLHMKGDKARGATSRLGKAVDAARALAFHDGHGKLCMMTCEPWQAADAVFEMASNMPAGKRRGVTAAHRATETAHTALEAFNTYAKGKPLANRK